MTGAPGPCVPGDDPGIPYEDADLAATRLAFDRVGDEIEVRASENPVLEWMRATNREELLGTFPPGSHLLEIGCGAGADAVFLAERGYRVTAIDLSARMVEATRRRVEAHGVAASVEVRRGTVGELVGPLRSEAPLGFDGAFANFSLSYEPSLRAVGVAVHSVTRRGSHFVATLPNRWALSVPAAAMLRGRPSEAFERWADHRRLVVRGVPLQTHDYSLREVRRALAGLYGIERVRGLPVFMPSSFLYQSRHRRIWSDLQRLDDRWDRAFPWRYLGETTLYRMRRVASAPPGPREERELTPPPRAPE